MNSQRNLLILFGVISIAMALELDLGKAFPEFDKDNDDKLSPEELSVSPIGVGLTPEKLQEKIAKHDKDKDGSWDLPEFLDHVNHDHDHDHGV